MECSLYLHIPFCEAKCAYCDFYSIPLAAHSLKDREQIINRYIDILLGETEKLVERYRPSSIPTIYIGGGTPSLLGTAGICRLMEGLPSSREITLEANPESADAAFLEACRSSGINRLSLGIQSFHESSRRAVGRIGDAKLLEQRIEAAAEIFGAGLSLDLMTGLPFQTEDILKNDIDRALAFAPGHISLYSLTVEAGTPLALRQNESRCATGFPSSDEADRLWIAGRDALEHSGYEQYEVSNFSLPGRRCAHNIRYWRMENWLGAGPSASGTLIFEGDRSVGAPDNILGQRLVYPPDVETFFANPKPVTEDLDRFTLIKESLLMGFRYIEGPDPDLFARRFGIGLVECIPRTLAAWRKKSGADGKPLAAEIALTREGLLFLNSFLLDAFREVDDSGTA